MKKENKKKLLLMIATLALVIISCSELTVTNDTSTPVQIIVNLPGGSSSDAILLSSYESEYFSSNYEGQYTVSAVPEDSYRERLAKLHDDFTLLLLEGIGKMSADQLGAYVTFMDNILTKLDEIKTVSCGGTLTGDESANAVISFDSNTGKWSISCGSD